MYSQTLMKWRVTMHHPLLFFSSFKVIIPVVWIKGLDSTDDGY